MDHDTRNQGCIPLSIQPSTSLEFCKFVNIGAFSQSKPRELRVTTRFACADKKSVSTDKFSPRFSPERLSPSKCDFGWENRRRMRLHQSWGVCRPRIGSIVLSLVKVDSSFCKRLKVAIFEHKIHDKQQFGVGHVADHLPKGTFRRNDYVAWPWPCIPLAIMVYIDRLLQRQQICTILKNKGRTRLER